MGSLSFTTAVTTPPVVVTAAASLINTTGATLNGNLTGLGSALSVAVSFQYGLTTAYGSTVTASGSPLSATGIFSTGISGLNANTLYHFRTVAVGDSTVYGADQSFTTNAAQNSKAVFSCRIAFTSGLYDASPVWTDVSADLISYSVGRSRQNQLDRFEAGTASMLLKNPNGNYTAKNTGGAYYPNVDIRKKINIQATYNGITYDRYTGFIRLWNPVYMEENGEQVPAVQVECTDGLRNLSVAKLNNAGYPQELGGARINHVLDSVGWPAAQRSIAPGQYQMAATGAIANVNALDHMEDVEDSEQALLWIRGDGYIVYQDLMTRVTAPYTTSNAIFGDGHLPIFTPQMPLDDDLLYNDIRLTRTGGTEQAFQNTASINSYGLSSYTKGGKLLTSDDDVAAIAGYLMMRFFKPIVRFKQMTVKPNYTGYESQLWPQALGREISDRISVVRNDQNINGDYFIEGIAENWDYRTQDFSIDWMLSDVVTVRVPTVQTDTLLPNGAGSVTQLAPTGFPNNWQCVLYQNDNAFVSIYGGSGEDSYALTDVGPMGYIFRVKIHSYCQENYINGDHGSAALFITIAGVTYSVAHPSPGGMVTYVDSFNLPPGITQAQINAAELGIILSSTYNSLYQYNGQVCFYLWVEITSFPNWP